MSYVQKFAFGLGLLMIVAAAFLGAYLLAYCLVNFPAPTYLIMLFSVLFMVGGEE